MAEGRWMKLWQLPLMAHLLAPYADLQLKQRLLPFDNIISPYLGVSSLVLKPEVYLAGDMEFLGINK